MLVAYELTDIVNDLLYIPCIDKNSNAYGYCIGSYLFLLLYILFIRLNSCIKSSNYVVLLQMNTGKGQSYLMLQFLNPNSLINGAYEKHLKISHHHPCYWLKLFLQLILQIGKLLLQP